MAFAIPFLFGIGLLFQGVEFERAKKGIEELIAKCIHEFM